jgi:hypothetical protein
MGISDTSTKARKVIFELYRGMSPARKIELIFDAYRTGQMLAMAGIRLQHPNATDKEIWHLWAKRHLGEDLYKKVYGTKKDE